MASPAVGDTPAPHNGELELELLPYGVATFDWGLARSFAPDWAGEANYIV